MTEQADDVILHLGKSELFGQIKIIKTNPQALNYVMLF